LDERRCQEIALFRYGIISDFVNEHHLEHGMQEVLIRYKCNRTWKIPHSKRTRIGRSTMLNWIRRYNQGGKKIESLYPRERSDKNVSRVIDAQTADNLMSLTKNSDIRSLRMLVDEMDRQHLVSSDAELTTSTVHRFLGQNNLTCCLKERKGQSKRARCADEDNKLWLRKLLQGRIKLDELKQDLGSKLPQEDIEALYDCLLSNGPYYRNRAVGILSLSKSLSHHLVSEYLFIPRSTLFSNYNTYLANGTSPVISDKGKRLLLAEDPLLIDKVFSILHCPPSAYGFNRTSWRQKDIQKAMVGNGTPISKRTIGQIISNSGFKYRKAREVLTSHDPEYGAKVQEIKDILSNLGPRDRFFSVDEYGPFAVKLQGGWSLVPPGTTKSIPQWQKSKGSIIITAALELMTNQITHFYSPKKNTSEMIKLLNIVVEKYSDEDHLYFSWDAASWHASKELYKRVDEINNSEYQSKIKSPIVKLAPLPTGSQFLNVIESVFSGMARAIIHNSDYQSVDDCMLAIDRYFVERNEHFQSHPKRAGSRIWGKERVKASFTESNNCKDPRYR
jgi:transposase